MRVQRKTWHQMLSILLSLAFVLSGTATTATPIHAQESSPLQIEQTASGVTLTWKLPDNPDWMQDFASQSAGNLLLPVHTFEVLLSGGQVEIHQLATRPYDDTLPAAPPLLPGALDYIPPPHLELAVEPLPAAPFFILREAVVGGQSMAVIALSPIYQAGESGQLHIAESLTGHIPGARLIDAETEISIATAAEAFGPDQALPPPNSIARRDGWKIVVSQGGIQELTAADLAAAGLNPPAAQTLRLFRAGQQVALHVIGANNNGNFDAIRFYAPPPGDRWNQTETYWLIQGETGERMVAQPFLATDAEERSTAFAEGTWRAPTFYNSHISGPSNDGWFHLDAVGKEDVAAADRRMTADIAPALPLALNSEFDATVRVAGSIYSLGGSISGIPYRLRFSSQNGPNVDDEWSFPSNRTTLDAEFEITLSAPTAELNVTLLVGDQPTAVLFDSIHWQQPVNLNFRVNDQNRGAAFSGVPGTWQYRLRNLPAGAVLYDVTDPASPTIVELGETDNNRLFVAGPEVRNFVLAGPGTVHKPALQRHTPNDLSSGGADALYIAPAGLHAALNPLVEHRRSQGYRVAVIDVQHIYDGWSYGQVEPDAIRNFLRHAVAAWRPAPIAVTLVGDGTHDPQDYLGFDNPNVIPPYMAHVDPYWGEVPCDNCYAQLNGDHPLSEKSFTMDIWLGRLPVIDATELQNVVNKIVRYETADDPISPWRRISVQITDDYFRPDGTLDKAGDFVASAESINALKPDLIHVIRNYFNVLFPPAGFADLPDKKREDEHKKYEEYSAWFVRDPDVAWRQTVSSMNQGAGLVTYTGHANHWKWASTTDDSENNYLFGLWDVLGLRNRNKLFIGLSMTCLSAQFSEPAAYHFTIDEHLVLHPDGGAVAVWGPAGLSIVHGHDALQRGFHQALWSKEPFTARLGELVEAGYREVRKETCCQDILNTFVLLGDPLTRAMVQPLDVGYVPTVMTP